MIELDDLARLLGRTRFDLTSEARTQADMERFLVNVLPAGSLRREVRLNAADRPDFVVDDCWIIEVKISRAPKRGVPRQLARYAEHDRVKGLILATNTALSLPSTVGGKPLRVVSLGRAWL